MNKSCKLRTRERQFAIASIGLLALLTMSFAFGAQEKRATDPLESRLRKVEDILAIQQVLSDYITYMDASDFGAYAAMFAADGELIFQKYRLTGPQVIRELMEKGSRDAGASRASASPGGLRHMMGNTVIRLEGDRATSTARWIVMSQGADGRPVVGATGHYEDLLRRDGAQWKFQRRVIYTDFPYDNPLATR